jgi:hypothetical protein
MSLYGAVFSSLVVVVLCMASVCDSASARTGRPAVFYVAPGGNDAWSGRLAEPDDAGTDGPFATITRARDAIREERKQAAEARPYTVRIRRGTYRLTEPIVFGPEDSGTEDAPVIYAGPRRRSAILSGGRVISGWKKGDGEIWTAEIPDVREGEWYFHQLFVNGERRTRARTPNDDYLRTDGPLPEIKNPKAERRNPAAKVGFRYKDGDLQRWGNLDDVNVFVYHSWTASLHWIKELDEENGTVRFTAGAHWPMGWWERNQRYYVENFLEALDEPGEWYLDGKTGVLHYWPLPGEDMRKATVVAPGLPGLVRFEGDPEAGKLVEHIKLRGLSFQHSDWFIADKGPADGQAAVFLGAAVHARGARHCSIERCEVAHVGEYGVWFGQGCQDNRVFHCHIHDLGGGGVRLGETGSPADEEQAALRNVVDNNFIHDGGHVFPAGVGVWIGRSSYNRVTHNDICDFYYTGISVGWSWGYAESSANNNTLDYNHIHHLGKSVLSDMGGIYSLGISPGTTERYNLMHDIYSYSYGGWGLYTDEGSSDMLLENNVVYNTKTGGFHQHYGRENMVRNNVLAFAVQSEIQRSRQEDHISFDFQRNIVYSRHGDMLSGNWSNGNYRIDHNLYWCESGDEPDFAGMELADWQAKGRDQHSIVADPLFVNPRKHNFRLKRNSPAAQIGFQPIDMSSTGLYGGKGWVNAPRKIKREPIEIPSPRGPQPLADDFEGTGVGETPRLATVSGEEKGASIRVTDEAAAGGKRSLKFSDAPGLEHVWQPHMYYHPRFRSGVMRGSFDVRVEPGAIFWTEWRDAASPYRIGPSVRIETDGTLKACDDALMTVPLGQWLHVEIVCALGTDATGTYDLTVTLPGEQPRKFEKLPTGSPEFRRLEWLGFISLANDTAAFYVDNLRLQQAE